VVTAEERVKIGAVKPIRRCVADFASIYDVLHSARRELLFVSPYISPEFIAILDFLSTRAPIRGVVAETPISLEAASILADLSQLALRCLARQSGIDCRLTTPIFITKWTIYCFVTSKAYAASDTTKLVVSVMRTVKAAPSPSGSIIAIEIVRLKKVRSTYGTSQRRNPTLRRTERK
jgi:hypothetical protein